MENKTNLILELLQANTIESPQEIQARERGLMIFGLKLENLKKSLCPKCNKILGYSVPFNFYGCFGLNDGTCDFRITTELYNDLIQPKGGEQNV